MVQADQIEKKEFEILVYVPLIYPPSPGSLAPIAHFMQHCRPSNKMPCLDPKSCLDGGVCRGGPQLDSEFFSTKGDFVYQTTLVFTFVCLSPKLHFKIETIEIH